ncbi:MAG: ABC transporter permease [Rubrivivax sp. SCN 71-131]|nr:MAG: ABC transporter permease [Rubrivivax sp. SCN 71-131]
MRLWQLAARNLLRNRRRSLATLLAMVVGLAAVLLFGGYRSNILHGLETGFVQYSGHLQVQRRGYFLDGGDNPQAYGIAEHPRMIEAIRGDPQLAPLLRVVTPSLQVGGIAQHAAAGQTRSVMAIGLVADEFNRMREWNAYGVVSYALPLALEGAPADAAVIGTGVARRLGLCEALAVPDCVSASPPRPGPKARGAGAATGLPDDLAVLAEETAQDAQAAGAATAAADRRIEMLAASAQGAPNVIGLQAVGYVNAGFKALDDVYLAMQLPQAQRLVYGREPPRVTAIAVQLQRTAQLPAARARLQDLLAQEFGAQELELLDYRELNPMLDQTDEFMGSMFGFITLLIGVIVLFTIANTMGAAVMERTVEIGTLRAMGMRRSGITALFLREALLLGLAGVAAGLLLTFIAATLINGSGWAWTPPGYSYAYLVLVRVWQDGALLAGSVAGMLAITLASAWWPARRAARLEIVEALRHA